ncbi:MAG: Holliday junction resolvase RuvX [Hyphomicrobiales bacterium]|nr:Holliday junction resolvase RuvX [Hyphomicrobiales bacterium]
MPASVITVEELLPLLPARGPLIGLDLGTKTIGIAISDVERRLAQPLLTLARRKFTLDAQDLVALAAQNAALGFVLGLPLDMDGGSGPRAQSTRAFARNFARLTELPIALWDERLSTVAVTRDLIEQGASRARRAQVVDRMAAAFILEGALSRLKIMDEARSRLDARE